MNPFHGYEIEVQQSLETFTYDSKTQTQAIQRHMARLGKLLSEASSTSVSSHEI